MANKIVRSSDSRKKIALCALIAILIAVSLLAILENQFPLKKEKSLRGVFYDDDFFLQDFSKTENVVMLGSSHVGQINTTTVNQQVITQLSKNYTVYNLGISADSPDKRVNQVDQIISMKPKVVFYGISYYDFPAVPERDHLLGKTTKILSDLINNGEEFDNPQVFTRYHTVPFKVERKIAPIFAADCFSVPNTPFDMACPSGKEPDTLEELKKLPNPVWVTDSSQERMIALSKIIEEFDKESIKIVLFITPVHQIYIDRLSDYQKNSFENIRKNLSEKYGVKIYDFRYRYDDLPVWSDTSHIIQTNGTIYDDDIAKMIIRELK